MLSPTPLSTQTRVLTVRHKAFSDDLQMINYAAWQEKVHSDTVLHKWNVETPFVWLTEDVCSQLQTGYQRTTITTCHLYIFQPVTPPLSPKNHYHHPQTTMSWLMISFPLGWQIYSFHFFLPHCGHLSNQTGLPLGRGAQGQDWVRQNGWGNVCRGNLGGKVLFESRLNITIIKFWIWKLGKKRSSDIGSPGFCHLA